MPIVYEPNGGVERSYDLISRLCKERIIMVTGEVNDTMALVVTSQLLFLDSLSSEPIKMYINSPGGSVVSGLAIYDTMRMVKSPIHTICIGMAASMGSIFMCGGDKRFILPHGTIMIHQVLSGSPQRQLADLEIDLEFTRSLNSRLTKILADRCGKSFDQMKQDMDRDNFFDARRALEYGLVDEILEPSAKDLK